MANEAILAHLGALSNGTNKLEMQWLFVFYFSHCTVLRLMSFVETATKSEIGLHAVKYHDLVSRLDFE
jgi:hypothetical protein